MDAPPPHEDPAVAPFHMAVLNGLSVRNHRLTSTRGSAARDFGDARFADARLRSGARARALRAATDVWSIFTASADAGLALHGLDQWLEELKLFTDWYCPALGLPVDIEGYRAAWIEALEPVASDGLGPVTILRDYHAENIMLIGGRDGIAHVGLLDFQDAHAGHPAYDLASVLEDARRDVPPALERAMMDRYMAAAGQSEIFERAYWALAAQRNTRIRRLHAPVEARQQAALHPVPAADVGPSRRDLASPQLAPVRAWFDANVSPEHRAAPWSEAA